MWCGDWRVRVCGGDLRVMVFGVTVRVWVCGVKIVWLDVCEGEGMCVAVTVRMVLQYVVCL